VTVLPVILLIKTQSDAEENVRSWRFNTSKQGFISCEEKQLLQCENPELADSADGRVEISTIFRSKTFLLIKVTSK